MKPITFLLVLLSFFSQAQDPLRFKDEITSMIAKNDSIWDANKETIVFTGSSSIRMWTDIQSRFPDHQVINTGFGGSQASDLKYYLNDVVLRYAPKKVFLYEGDNDVADKKGWRTIMKDIDFVVNAIKAYNPDTQIVLISPKPSVARWNLKKRYVKLNKKLKDYVDKTPNTVFIDMWPVMVKDRQLNEDIFIEDGIHMNTEGYDLWYNVLKDYVN